MISVTDTASLSLVLDSSVDPDLKRLLAARCDQLMDDTGHECDLHDLVHFIATDASNTINDIEMVAGYPIITEPAFEWVADHGGWYEAVTVLSDDGFGVVLFVPNDNAVEPTLLTLLRAEVVATTAAADRA